MSFLPIIRLHIQRDDVRWPPRHPFLANPPRTIIVTRMNAEHPIQSQLAQEISRPPSRGSVSAGDLVPVGLPIDPAIIADSAVPEGMTTLNRHTFPFPFPPGSPTGAGDDERFHPSDFAFGSPFGASLIRWQTPVPKFSGLSKPKCRMSVPRHNFSLTPSSSSSSSRSNILLLSLLLYLLLNPFGIISWMLRLRNDSPSFRCSSTARAAAS